MLRISKLADYGTVIMHCLAREPERLTSANDIARKTHVALPTVSKVLKILVAAHLVVSMRGKGGGYRLSRQPEDITVMEMISALDGEPALTECNVKVGKCLQDSVCAIRDNWRLINQTILAALSSFTLADMLNPLDLHPLVVGGIQFDAGKS